MRSRRDVLRDAKIGIVEDSAAEVRLRRSGYGGSRSRRTFITVSLAATGGLLVAMRTELARRADADAGADRTARLPDRLHPDRSRRSRADLVGAAGDGRRHQDVAADARRRGARRRLDAGAHRRCAARSRNTAARASAAAMRFDRTGIACAASAPPRARCWSPSAAARMERAGEPNATPACTPCGMRRADAKRGYGALAARAATLTVPRDVPLKDPSRYRLIGTRVNGTDNHKVVTGQPLFGIDVRLPNMKFAAVAKCPVFNGRPVKIDATKARQVPGVRDIVEINGPRQPHLPDAGRRRGRRFDMGGVQGPRRARRAMGRRPLREREQRDAQRAVPEAAGGAARHAAQLRPGGRRAGRGGDRRRQHVSRSRSCRTPRSSRTTAPPTFATARCGSAVRSRCR